MYENIRKYSREGAQSAKSLSVVMLFLSRAALTSSLLSKWTFLSANPKKVHLHMWGKTNAANRRAKSVEGCFLFMLY